MLVVPTSKWRANIEAYLEQAERRIEAVKAAVPEVERLIREARWEIECARWSGVVDLVWELNSALENLGR